MEKNKEYSIQDLFKDVYNAYKSAVEEVKKDERFQDALKDFKAAAYLFNDGKTYKWDTEKGETCECDCKKKESKCCECGGQGNPQQGPQSTYADQLKKHFGIQTKSEIEAKLKQKKEEIKKWVKDNLKSIDMGGKVFIISDNTAQDGDILFGMTAQNREQANEIEWVLNGGTCIEKEDSFEYLDLESVDDCKVYAENPLTDELARETGFDFVFYEPLKMLFIFQTRA